MARSLPSLVAAALALLASLPPAMPAQAAGPPDAGPRPIQAALPVDVALVIAVDVSLSMDMGEQALQRDGYVDAFRHPDLLATIQNGLHQRIAVTYVEWGSEIYQAVILPWTIVEDRASAEAVAARLASAPIRRSRATAISAALDFAMALFAAKEVEALRRVIDVSGDGPNNDGRPVLDARAAALGQGITINGLPVMLRPTSFNPWSIPDLDVYYNDCVIGGPGAFVLPVQDPADFKDAIRQKLLLEIAATPPAIHLAGFTPAQARMLPPDPPRGETDCLIGERLRRQMWPD